MSELRRHNHFKIIQKSVFIFSLPYMAIKCEHVHRLELRIFLKLCIVHSPDKREIRTIFRPYMSEMQNAGITAKWHPCYVATVTQNLKYFRNSIIWTISHVMAILRGQNKNTDFLLILPDCVALKKSAD